MDKPPINTVLAMIREGIKCPDEDYELKGWRRFMYKSLNIVVILSLIALAIYLIK